MIQEKQAPKVIDVSPIDLVPYGGGLASVGPEARIVVDPAHLPDLSSVDRICFDVETISFDDRVAALNPWAGHRIQGLALCTLSGHRFYLPVRHRDPAESLLPMEAYLAFCRDLFCSRGPDEREVFGHNVKFDLRFLRADGIVPTCKVADTMVLARLVDNSMPRLNLDFLGTYYGIGGKTADEVKAFCKGYQWTDELGEIHRGTQDFGRCPVRLIAPYAMRDVAMTYSLRRILEGKLAPFSRDLWETEKTFTSVLAEVESDGVVVDVKRLKQEWKAALTRMIEINEEINRIAGWEVDPNSESDKTQLLCRQLGVVPTSWTATGKPQWTKAVLHNLKVPDTAPPEARDIGRLFQAWSYLGHFTSTYIEGWLGRLAADKRLHPDLKQAGTITGRLSAGDPNTQNIPVEAERYIIAPPGHAIVAFDFSQIEYRMFAHYTDDPTIKGAYATDPDADFHQYLADQLGVPRQFAKTLNFALLYGMGEKKLLLSLVAMLTVARARGESGEMEKKMRDLAYVSGTTMAEHAKEYIKGEAQRADGPVVHEYVPAGGSVCTECGAPESDPAHGEEQRPRRVETSELSQEQIAALSAMVSNTGGAAIAEKGKEYIAKMAAEGKVAAPSADAADLSLRQQAGMHDLIHAGGKAMAERAKEFAKGDGTSELEQQAKRIFDEYHEKFPSIRRFSAKVHEVAKVRKYVRNVYGRKYDFDMSRYDTADQRRAFGPHRAVNYLIQGSSADLLRRKIIELRRQTYERFGARLFMTVHDSVYFYVPRENAAAFYVEAKRILEDCPEISVPIRVDGKVSMKSVAADVSVKEKGGRSATVEEVEAALVEAESAKEHGEGAVESSQGYRVGRHGV